MNKETRRIVIYSLFGLFFVFGAIAVFYAQGYRFDLGTFSIRKVGAIYVSTYPKNADLTVDGKNVDRGSMILNSGTLVPDLFPKSHELVLKAPGFLDWKITVPVNPSLVTEVRAVLLPEKPELVLEKAPLDFWALPDTPLIEFLPGLSYSGSKIPGNFSALSPDKSQVLTRDASKNYYVTNLGSGAIIKSQKLLNITGGRVSFDTTPSQFLSYNNTSLALLSIGSSPLTVFTAPKGQTIAAAGASKNLLVFTALDKQNNSWLWLYEKVSGNTKKIDSVPGKTVDLKLSSDGKVILLQDSGDLYQYDSSDGSLSKLSAGVKLFALSEDGTDLAILSEKTLEVYGENGYAKMNLSFLPGIEKVYWYSDNYHLFLQFSGRLGLLDLADLQPENLQTVNNSSKNSYDPISNSLYFIKDSSLYRIVFPS